MEQGQLQSVTAEEEVVPASQIKELEKRIRSLERMLGRKTEEAEILKEAIQIARQKKLISQKPLRGIDDFE
jgi:transposase